jgi:hypothetical protein
MPSVSGGTRWINHTRSGPETGGLDTTYLPVCECSPCDSQDHAGSASEIRELPFVSRAISPLMMCNMQLLQDAMLTGFNARNGRNEFEL